MRVAFFGLPLAALLLHADGHDIVFAGICRKGAIGTRRLRRVLGKERVSVVPKLGDATVFERVRDAKPELLVSWFWTKRIPEAMLRLAPLGTVGVHPSLLPRHRGPDPYFWTIFAGDHEAGVTAHRLEREYDTGAMLGQKRIAVDSSWNAWTLAKKLDRPSLALLREVVRAFGGGKPPVEVAQDDALATVAPSPDDEDLRLTFGDRTADEVVRLVRAAAPYPGAFLETDDDDVVVVTRAAVEPAVPRALEPGEAAMVNGRAVVRAKDTGVALLRGRLVRDADEPEQELNESELAALVGRLSRDASLA